MEPVNLSFVNYKGYKSYKSYKISDFLLKELYNALMSSRPIYYRKNTNDGRYDAMRIEFDDLLKHIGDIEKTCDTTKWMGLSFVVGSFIYIIEDDFNGNLILRNFGYEKNNVGKYDIIFTKVYVFKVNRIYCYEVIKCLHKNIYLFSGEKIIKKDWIFNHDNKNDNTSFVFKKTNK